MGSLTESTSIYKIKPKNIDMFIRNVLHVYEGLCEKEKSKIMHIKTANDIYVFDIEIGHKKSCVFVVKFADNMYEIFQHTRQTN